MPKGSVKRHVRRLYTSTDTGDLAAGNEIRVPIGKAVPRQLNGAWMHLVGLVFRATVQYDKVAATMAGALDGKLVRTALRDIILQAGGHKFLDQVDGADLMADLGMRCGVADVNSGINDLSDADASNATTAFKAIWMPGNPTRSGKRKQEGAIPVGIFADDRNAEDVLRFTIASTFDGFAGITIDGLTSLQVDGIFECYDTRHFPLEHRLRKVVDKNASSILETRGPVSLLAITTRKDDAGTYVLDQTNFDTISVKVGDTILYAGKTPAELAAYYEEHRLSEAGLNGSGYPFAVSAPEELPLVTVPVDADRGDMPWGPFTIDTENRSAQPHTRFTIREEGIRTRPVQEKWFGRYGLSMQTVPVKFDANGNAPSAFTDLKV